MDLETLARPYRFRGKAHSVRTLHTALERVAGKGSLSFDKEGAYIRKYDGSGIVFFPRTFDGDLSVIGERD